MVRIGFFNENNVNKWGCKNYNKLRFLNYILEFSGKFLHGKEKVEQIQTNKSILVIEVTNYAGQWLWLSHEWWKC